MELTPSGGCKLGEKHLVLDVGLNHIESFDPKTDPSQVEGLLATIRLRTSLDSAF
jgi:hypothetical protein